MFIKSLNYRLLVAGFILSISCSSSGKKYLVDTIAFGNYLEQHNFKSALKSDSIDFVLVSSSACHGCVQKSFNRLLAEKNVVLIAGSKTLQPNDSFIQSCTNNYLEDETDDLDRLKYHKRNIGIIRMYNKQIYDIITWIHLL